MATAEIDMSDAPARKTLAQWKAEASGTANASCPKCGCEHFLADSEVYKTYHKPGLMLPSRYRKCRNCGFKVVTQEVIRRPVAANGNDTEKDRPEGDVDG
jgi:predicted RNA-binding Zn-ribbon protein involved in translation (DUF1610 family)